ncbi:hypothetical protein SAMN05216464_103157 [Mucilaginibacter pineti]|uniref:Uncharacterized protein n=1 Tax=Mucilaginibacter pineti TaxID=1391627 RepID=A0A1G6YZR4_9SPHI|nr:hypothetical protein [Mucilaginibacter pineti]SDD95762.1 hypothetical protein SAMN05216464_103157 [Mucilaginibacter pineti]
MEHNEEKNMQDEIIDSLAKKVTQLVNRQQKVEELNLGTLPPKIKELEAKVTETTNMRILDYSKQLDQFGRQLNGFDGKINAIPKETKATVQFDTKSKFVIKILLYMGLGILTLLASTISLWIENNRRADDKNKYIIVQGLFPKTARYIDSVYINNPEYILKVAKNNIEEKQKLIDAALAAKEAAEQAKQADENLQKLKGKKQPEKKKKGKK